MEHAQTWVSIVVVCVFCLVGLPVWWNTTKVYRAPLPHDEIHALHNSPVKLKVPITIVNTFLDKTSIDKLRSLIEILASGKYNIEISVSFVTEKPKSDYCENSDALRYKYVLVSSTTSVIRRCSESLTSIISETNFVEIAQTINQDLLTILPIEDLEVLSSAKRSTKNSMSLAPGYRLSFTLAVADPASRGPVSWNIEQAIAEYLSPILNHFSYLGPFNVSSQVLYYTDLSVTPKKYNKTYYYNKDKLPLIINPIESRLGYHTSTNPTLNFVVYVPPLKYTPLYIGDKNSGTDSKLVAFQSPRWGGFVFYNPEVENTKNKISNEVMTHFANQLKSLLGADINLETNFARQKLLILKTFENLKTSIATLKSLSKLLDEIANIVIRDDINDLIKSSVQDINLSFQMLNEGKIEQAFDASKRAFECSEKAFYDHSLLALLYFPDDQKYAIYIPLFLPISIPVVTTFFKAVKSLKQTH